MPTLNLQHSLLEYIQNLNGSEHSPESWSEWLPAIGCPVEGSDEEVLEVEVFPDRPDLLSHETMARAGRAFLQGEIQDQSIQTSDSGMVLDVDSDRRRVSLGIKQCNANPWEEFAAIHKKGDQITGQIKSITDFGVFIGLDGGIDGLIHLSDLSWDDTGEDVARNYNKGDEVTAVVLAVDADRERISLGLKQSQSDPFVTFVSENPKGSLVKGTVESVDAKAATIKLADGVEGMLRATELSRDYVEDARMLLNEGDAVEVKVTSIERKDRRITLSIKAMELDRESQAVKDYGTQAIGTTSLGDKLKEQLDKSFEPS